MRFGVCTGLENGAVLAQAGYEYVEPSVAGAIQPEQPEGEVMPGLLAALQTTPLRAETYNILLPADLKVVGPVIDIARQERYLHTAFARAAALGGRIVVFGSGAARRIPDGFSVEEAHRQVLDFIRRCGAAAARQGLGVAIEPLNKKECNFINSVGEAVELAHAADHPAVGVLSDLYHITEEGQSFAETRAAGAWLKHVHVAGAEGRRAPVQDDAGFLIPYFRALKEMGYDGRISVEGQWDDLPGQAAGCLAVLRQAWKDA